MQAMGARRRSARVRGDTGITACRWCITRRTIVAALTCTLATVAIAAAGPSDEVNRMLITYRAVHSMRIHVTVPGATWEMQYEAPNRYKVDSNLFNAIVIGEDAWTLQRHGWRHMPRGTGTAILENLNVYRSIYLTGGTYDYQITDRGVTPGVGHQYEFRRRVGRGDRGWVWIRPDHLPSQVHKSTGSWAYFTDFNIYNNIEPPAGATDE